MCGGGPVACLPTYAVAKEPRAPLCLSVSSKFKLKISPVLRCKAKLRAWALHPLLRELQLELVEVLSFEKLGQVQPHLPMTSAPSEASKRKLVINLVYIHMSSLL